MCANMNTADICGEEDILPKICCECGKYLRDTGGFEPQTTVLPSMNTKRLAKGISLWLNGLGGTTTVVHGFLQLSTTNLQIIGFL